MDFTLDYYFFYIYIRIERSWDEWALGHTATSRKVVGKKSALDNPER